MLAIMTRLRLLVALIGVGALAALLALAAFSSAASADHSWGNYHWALTQSSDKAALQLGDNVSGKWDTHLRITAGQKNPDGSPADNLNDWDAPADTNYTYTDKLDPKVVQGLNLDNPKRCSAKSGRVEVCNAKYGYNGWLGLAQIWASGGHIVQGVAKMNDTYFNLSKYNNDPWRNLVMCQEVGHTFGLDHTDEIHNNTNLGSCMDYTNDPDGGGSYGADNQYPGGDNPITTAVVETYHDYDHLAVIYNHGDGSTTIGSSTAASKLPPAANRGSFNSSAEWGRLVHTFPGGKLEIWQRGLGADKELITWVIRP